MTLSVLEGEADVTAVGTTVTVPQGFRVRVPLDDEGNASGEPSEPEPLDPAALSALPVNLLPIPVPISADATPEATAEASSGGALTPTPGQWQWVTGELAAEGCPPALVAAFEGGTISTGTFTLPEGEFGIDFLFNAASQEPASATMPNPVFSKTDPNVYVLEFSDADIEGSYVVTVVSPDEIQGQMNVSVMGCTVGMGFTVTRIGD